MFDQKTSLKKERHPALGKYLKEHLFLRGQRDKAGELLGFSRCLVGWPFIGSGLKKKHGFDEWMNGGAGFYTCAVRWPRLLLTVLPTYWP